METEYGIPVYFSEAAAARPDRALLEEVRRGQLKGCAMRCGAKWRGDRMWADGAASDGGGLAVGARRFLIRGTFTG